jgi:hypothetical protein
MRVSRSVLTDVVLAGASRAIALIAQPQDRALERGAAEAESLARLVNERYLLELQVDDLEAQHRAMQAEQLQAELATSSRKDLDRLEKELLAARTLGDKAVVAYDELLAQNQRMEQQRAALQAQVDTLSTARTFQAIQVIDQMRRTPRDIPKLALRLWRVVKRGQAVAPTATASAQPVHGTPPQLDPRQQFARLLSGAEDKVTAQGAWVALVGASWLGEQLGRIVNVVALHPNTGLELLRGPQPDLLLVDATHMLAGTPWEMTLQGSAYGQPFHLMEILKLAGERNVRRVLWLNLPLSEARGLVPTLRFFDEVLIADPTFFMEAQALPELSAVALSYLPGLQAVPQPRLCSGVVSPELYCVYSIVVSALANEARQVVKPLRRSQLLGTAGFDQPVGLLVLPARRDSIEFIPPEMLAAAARGLLPVLMGPVVGGPPSLFAGLVPLVEDVEGLVRLQERLKNDPSLFHRWRYALATEASIKFDLAGRAGELFGTMALEPGSSDEQRHGVVAVVGNYRDLNKLQQVVQRSGASLTAVCCVVATEELQQKCKSLFGARCQCLMAPPGDTGVLEQALRWCLAQEASTIGWLDSGTAVDDLELLRLRTLLLGAGADVCGHPQTASQTVAAGIPAAVSEGYEVRTELRSDALMFSRRYVERWLALGQIDISGAVFQPEPGVLAFAGPPLGATHGLPR